MTSMTRFVLAGGDAEAPFYWNGLGPIGYTVRGSGTKGAIGFASHEDADTVRKWVCRNPALRIEMLTETVH